VQVGKQERKGLSNDHFDACLFVVFVHVCLISQRQLGLGIKHTHTHTLLTKNFIKIEAKREERKLNEANLSEQKSVNSVNAI